MFVGALDLIFGFGTIILGCCGVIKNDIKVRRAEADEINKQRKRIEEEINSRLKLELDVDKSDKKQLFSINADG